MQTDVFMRRGSLELLFIGAVLLLSDSSPMAEAPRATARPLVARLRTVNDRNRHYYADANGPRRVLFASWFPALRIWRDNRPAALEQLDDIAAAGYHGVRIFHALAADYNKPTTGFWAGRDVSIAWSIDALVGFGRAARDRGLKLHLTQGHRYVSDEEEYDYFRRLATAIRDNGLSDTIALWEMDNEYFQNTEHGDSPKQSAIHRRLMAIIREILPGVLVAPGSLNAEAPEALYRSSVEQGADVCVIHGAREFPDAAQRAFNLWYWDGDPGHFPLPFWHGEPVGPDGPTPASRGVYLAHNRPGSLVALYAIQQITGGAVNFFNGPAVRYLAPLDATWGFWEVPRLLADIPDDIALWRHESGGHIGWWTDGTRAITVTLEGWDYAPRRPLARWKVIGPRGAVEEGEGDLPRLPAGYGGALIVGSWR